MVALIMEKAKESLLYTLAERNMQIVGTGSEEDKEYKKLLQDVFDAGLFRRTYLPYALLTALAFLGVLTSFYFMTLTTKIEWQLLNGIFFGFWSVQLGALAHDLSHGGVFVSKKKNRFFAMLQWCFVCGMSEERWFEKHNEHHKSPNHEGHDPDLEIPFVFSLEQMSRRSVFFKKYILHAQRYMFWFALPLVYLMYVSTSFKYLFHEMNSRRYLEVALMLGHFVGLFWITFTLLGVLSGSAFLVAAFLTISVYMGLIFAPNHKGEDILGEHEKFSWTHQITHTRNIRASLSSFYLTGGLSYQIEHHLFPTMSRFQFKKARLLVQKYCQENNLQYHETSWLQSMKDIDDSLNRMQTTP